MRIIATAWVSLAILSGCASLTGTRQVVAVDSVPRGQPVSIPKAEPEALGKTPYFTSIRRAKRFSLEISDERKEIDCRFRWLPVFLGNAPFLLVTSAWGLLYLAALGLDAWTGAAWECPSYLKLEPQEPRISVDTSTPCDTALLIPVGASDPQSVAELESAWRRRPLQKGDCTRLVAPDSSDAILARHGFLETETMNQAERRLRNQGSALGFATGATHFVLVSKGKDKQGRDSILTRKLDAFSLVKQEETGWEEEPESRIRSRSPWALVTAFGTRLIPNSVGFTVSSTSFQKSLPDSEFDVAQHEGTGINLSTVSHPLSFSPWDFVLDLSPSVSFRYLQMKLAPLPDVPFERRFRVLAGTADVMGLATAHTPLGALSLGLGIGTFSLLAQDRDSRIWRDGFAIGTLVRGSYQAFFSERIFGEFSVQPLIFLSGSEALSPHRGFDRTTVMAVSIGTHVPELPIWVGRKLLP